MKPAPAPSASRGGILAASLAIYLFWGASNFFMKMGMRTIPPLVMAGSRLLLAGTLMTAFALWRGHRLVRGHVKSLLGAGALLFLGGHGLLYWGQQRLPSGIGVVLLATMPLWVALVEGFLPGGIHLGVRALSGITLGLLGVLMLVGPRSLLGAGQVNVAGAIAMVLAALSWGLGSIFCARATLPSSGALTGGMEMLMGGSMLIIAAAVLGETRGFHLGQVAPHSWLALAYLVLVSSLIGFSCFVWLLRNASPARVASYAYVTPVVAVILGWAAAGDAITPRILLAIALLLSAVVLIVTARNKRLAPAEMDAVAP